MTKQDIGKIVKKKRTGKGLTQKQLAEMVVVPANRIYELEKGQFNYGIDTLLKVCDALSIKIKIG